MVRIYLNKSGYERRRAHSRQSHTVVAKEELKRALKEYKGSILLICHEPEFYSGLATTSRWLVGSSRRSTLVSRLISLHRRTLACSPPLSTRTWLSM